jgi:hypothetical protein
MSNIALLYEAIQKEISSISFHAVHFFRFVNHFYGCISVLEMLAQEELLGLVDIAHVPFAEIGKEYGFFNEGPLAYKISNPDYEEIWITIWKEVGEEHRLDIVDDIEEKTFIIVEQAERSRGLTFLKRALAQMALTPEQVSMISELLASSDIGLASDKPEASQNNSGMPEKTIQKDSGISKPDTTQIVSGVPELKPEDQKLEVQKLETTQVSPILPETKTAIKTVDLNQAASLIQKRFRKTRRHRAATPMVNVTHRRATAFTHRRKRT